MAEQTPNNLLVNYMMAQNPASALAYQRQQALAQMLADNSNDQLAPNAMASPGGYVINQNPMIMAGKAIEKGISGYLQGKNQKALAQALQGNSAITPNASDVTNSAIASETPAGSPAPVQGPASAQQLGAAIQGQTQPDPTTVTGTPQGDMWLAQMNPERYKFMAAIKEAERAKTPEIKNAEYGTANNTPAGNLVYGNSAKGAILPDQTFNGRTGVPIDMRNGQPLGGNLSPVSPPARVTSAPTEIPPIPTMDQAPAGMTAPPTPAQTNTASVAAPTIQGFGKPLGSEAQANKDSENLAETQKTFNLTASNLPRALQRFEELKKASKDASYGLGIDENGDGVYPEAARTPLGHIIEPNTATANQTIQQASKQGIIAELGPQLVGMRPNKFLESIATGASGLNAADRPETKVNAVQGLEDQYVGSLKSLANQIRGYGGQAPSDTEIDAMVAKARPGGSSGNGAKVIQYNAQGQRM